MSNERVPPPGEVRGSVVLVGCGPGDPDLLTLKAVRAIAAADVLVVDRLVPDAIVALVRPGARVLYAGKEAGGPSVSQLDINRWLVREALLGNRVARLKSGDSFVFGRAAEEMAAVRSAGLEVDVIPGITAAHACAASIGLPLTLRRSVRQFTVLTGATAEGEVDLDWDALARPGQAFAIYMGVRTAPTIEERLLAGGADPRLPVVIVENGTRESERVVATRLADLGAAIGACGIGGPAILFAGLSWEEANLSMPSRVEVFETTGMSKCATGRGTAPRHADDELSR